MKVKIQPQTSWNIKVFAERYGLTLFLKEHPQFPLGTNSRWTAIFKDVMGKRVTFFYGDKNRPLAGRGKTPAEAIIDYARVISRGFISCGYGGIEVGILTTDFEPREIAVLNGTPQTQTTI